MLDIKFIRENKELIDLAAKKKGLDFDVNDLVKIDDERRALLSAIEAKRAEQNKTNAEVVKVDGAEKAKLIKAMTVLKESLGKDEDELKEVLKKWQAFMLQVPNIPDMSVPDGAGEAENKEVKVFGEKTKFDFEPKNHIEIMEELGMADFERGTKVHGFRGYFLKGAGAELSWAIWNYARDFYKARNFTPFIAPVIVRKQYFYGTGHLPREAEDLYKTQDEDYLSGTAEVPMMAYHADEVLKKSDLPKKYLAFSPCYRREAGSYSKDTKGFIRVHEFYKLEQLILCEADHAVSADLHEEINSNFEIFVESLGLPYRRLLICTGDLSSSKVKQYDTEAWFPAQNVYRELSSASYYHDFQTRRFNIRYDDGTKKRYAHSLNCTAVATPRILACIVENYQKSDGSVGIPEVLQKYFGGEKINKK